VGIEKWSVDTFKKETDGGLLTSRKGDPILMRIDALLGEYLKPGKSDDWKDGYTQLACLGDMFWCADTWLKDHAATKDPAKKKRTPGIQTFYKDVAESLAEAYGVTINVLPRELEDHFGKSMSDHGKETDKKTANIRTYLERHEAAQFRVFIRKGLCYQFQWWEADGKKAKKLVLMDTSGKQFGEGIDRARAGQTENSAGYVLSMNRTMYSGCHKNTTTAKFYHSAYLAGSPVQCGGTVVVEKGVLRMVNNGSGHYQPGPDKLVNVLETLKAAGLDLKKIVAATFQPRTPDSERNNTAEGYWDYNAEEFLKKRGKMDPADVLPKTDPLVKAYDPQGQSKHNKHA
jgi:hypothetical protein